VPCRCCCTVSGQGQNRRSLFAQGLMKLFVCPIANIVTQFRAARSSSAFTSPRHAAFLTFLFSRAKLEFVSVETDSNVAKRRQGDKQNLDAIMAVRGKAGIGSHPIFATRMHAWVVGCATSGERRSNRRVHAKSLSFAAQSWPLRRSFASDIQKIGEPCENRPFTARANLRVCPARSGCTSCSRAVPLHGRFQRESRTRGGRQCATP
jgi:hypothetical protein